MKRTLVSTLAALSLGLLPAATPAVAATPIDCGPGDGRDRITTQGFESTFDAPPGATPIPAQARSAHFYFTADLAPYAAATVTFRIAWADATYDYDMYLYDADEAPIGSSDEVETNFEQLELPFEHCQSVHVEIRNYRGIPDHPITLTVQAAGDSGKMLACAANDPAPGCAGKAEGEPPALVPDTRPRLYLGGDAGQASMVWAYQSNPSPFRGTLQTTRPTTGKPNQYTRPVVGLRDQYRNPFVAHWSGTLEQPRLVQGAAQALIWASSASEDATGRLFVDLYGDGSLIGQTTVSGDKIAETPTPLRVTVPITEPVEATEFTLQVATNPAAGTGGPGNPAEAHITLFYGCVQFPARVTLP